MARRHDRDSGLPLKISRELPTTGHGVSVRELIRRLGLEDSRTVERRLQRQLQRLCEEDPPVAVRSDNACEGDLPRTARYLAAPAPGGRKPSRSQRLADAIEAKIVLDHLRPILPFDIGAMLATRLDEAQSALTATRNNQEVVWADRVRVVPAGHPLHPPRIDEAVHREVEKAIDRGRRLHFRYSRFPEKRADEITCDPLGLLFRPPVLYLIARNAKGALRQYALHRMERAELLADRATTSGFDFDDFIRQGEADMTWGGEPVRVVVAATDTFAKIWHGTPLGDEQTIAPCTVDDEFPWRVAATVPNTHLLRAYLLSLGTEALVLEPQEIADWVQDQAATMAKGIRKRRKQLRRA